MLRDNMTLCWDSIVLPYAAAVGENVTLMDGNVRFYRDRFEVFLNEEGNTREWIAHYIIRISSIFELEQTLTRALVTMPPDCIIRLISSMRHCCQDVIHSFGGNSSC